MQYFRSRWVLPVVHAHEAAPVDATSLRRDHEARLSRLLR